MNVLLKHSFGYIKQYFDVFALKTKIEFFYDIQNIKAFRGVSINFANTPNIALYNLNNAGESNLQMHLIRLDGCICGNFITLFVHFCFCIKW